ncbi:replication-relaxation family protein [Bdellovibrio sp. HCB290]|uniref:replication-relaxation family protein n=1 Tax=Bdellovibrio sp. HCB290 TaxID=3394356 RepID=UPI0039B53B6C
MPIKASERKVFIKAEYKAPNVMKAAPVAPQLNSKEMELLKYILEMRYLSLAQVIRRFYDNGTVEATIQRMFDLKYLYCKDKELSDSSLLLVTQKGRDVLVSQYKEIQAPAVTRSPMPGRLNHDMLLNDLRIRFEELNFLKRWVSEMCMKEMPFFLRAFADLPDALCKKNNGMAYFLELEVGKKHSKFYRDRIDTYLKVLQMKDTKEAKIEGVIFFCYYEEVAEMIKAQVPKDAKGVSVLTYQRYFPAKKDEKQTEYVH